MEFAEIHEKLSSFRAVACGLSGASLALSMISNLGVTTAISSRLVTTLRPASYDTLLSGDAAAKTAVFDYPKIEAWLLGCFTGAALRRWRNNHNKTDGTTLLLWLKHRHGMTTKMKNHVSDNFYSVWQRDFRECFRVTFGQRFFPTDSEYFLFNGMVIDCASGQQWAELKTDVYGDDLVRIIIETHLTLYRTSFTTSTEFL